VAAGPAPSPRHHCAPAGPPGPLFVGSPPPNSPRDHSAPELHYSYSHRHVQALFSPLGLYVQYERVQYLGENADRTRISSYSAMASLRPGAFSLHAIFLFICSFNTTASASLRPPAAGGLAG
jgi:hypothetical protein